MAQFIEFEIDRQRYAFPICQIREILILKNITPMPQVPNYVAGVSNLRGEIIPIVDLRVMFGLPHRKADEQTRTIVVNVAEKTIGAMVDAVARVLRVEKDSVSEPPENMVSNGRDYIQGFVKSDDRLVIILDAERLFTAENFEKHPTRS
jgi:purine-binding chemotaxis protein CheW